MAGNTVYAAYDGSQKGFTVRTLELSQISAHNLGFSISDIAVGANDDVYLASQNHLYQYKVDGTLIKDMEFPMDSIIYTNVTVLGDKVYASYQGSQQGVTIRDLSLNQLASFSTGIDASGIAVSESGEIYLTAANHIYKYSAQHQLLEDMEFPYSSIIYSSVTVLGDKVYASYQGSQQGVTVRDLNLNQLSSFSTGFDANSIAAGPKDDVYLAAANHIYNYSVSGSLITDMEFPGSDINYTGVSV